MTVGKGKRPRDRNQLAKWIGDQSTGQRETPEKDAETSQVTPMPPQTSHSIWQPSGAKGSDRRETPSLKTSTKEQRRKVAAKAARTRWQKARKQT
jgi:hypothetical protein